MKRTLSSLGVRIERNGGYWRVRWTDSTGQRRSQGLGPTADMTKRQAVEAARRIAAEHVRNPGMKDADRAMTLRGWWSIYSSGRGSELAEATLVACERSWKYLQDFAGADTKMADIDRKTAGAFRDWLASQSYRDKPLGPQTIAKHIRHIKAVFGEAVEREIVGRHPFDRVSGQAPKVSRKWRYVTTEETTRIMEQCKTEGWKHLIALCRFAGLRRGEALGLCWTDIDWATRTMNVYAKKTKDYRTVPIRPELYSILEVGYHTREAKWVCWSVGLNNLNRDMAETVKKAGMTTYAKLFHTLRKNAESDWLAKFPVFDVCQWMGHSPEVSREHYHQTLSHTMLAATETKDPLAEAQARILLLERQLSELAPKSAPNPKESSV